MAVGVDDVALARVLFLVELRDVGVVQVEGRGFGADPALPIRKNANDVIRYRWPTFL
ncbi:hypothetical protein GKQ77_00645 [Streptomyces sp. BG9H]|uniref:Uncharacterized protein n=1 Tax=Streptomyces anatolicus TaxID=2675858 RepID=A0ABS6YFA1_9ACTN|nr:hypothetical protein [Streptomyces anatolicus]